MVSNLVYAVTLTIYYGCGNLHSVIQDFSYNACPYDWNTGEYLAVTLLLGLFASQLTALVIFLLARVGAFFCTHGRYPGSPASAGISD